MFNEEKLSTTESRLIQRAKNCEAGAPYVMLKAEDFDNRDDYGSYNTFIEALNHRLYLYGTNGTMPNGVGVTTKDLDFYTLAILKTCLKLKDAEKLLKNFGNYFWLISKVYRRNMKPEAQLALSILKRQRDNAEVNGIARNGSVMVSEEAKANEINTIDEEIKKIRNGNSYELEIYHQLNANAFKKQFENAVAYMLLKLKMNEDYQDLEQRTNTHKWNKMKKRAVEAGLSKEVIMGYVATEDYSGLRKAVEDANVAANEEKVKQALDMIEQFDISENPEEIAQEEVEAAEEADSMPKQRATKSKKN